MVLPLPSTESAILLPDRSYVLFLRLEAPDTALAQRHEAEFPPGEYATVVAGRQGRRDLDPTLIEALQVLCEVRGLDPPARAVAWTGLQQHANPLVRDEAQRALRQWTPASTTPAP